MRQPDLIAWQPSGTWHHQVRAAAGPTHMARSSRQGFGGDDLEVEQWVESPIAAKLDNAMTWVDSRIDNPVGIYDGAKETTWFGTDDLLKTAASGECPLTGR